ncbi:MAG: extracellular solute-binding protein, partial [Trebonia sp.]
MARSRKFRYATATVAAVTGLVTLAAGCAGPSNSTSSKKPTSVPAKPKKPVTLNIMDIAGNLQLTKGMIEDFKKAHPDIVKNVTYSTAPAPEMAGKLKAQQQAGQVQTDLVLTGTDGLSAGIKQGLLDHLMPDYQTRLGDINAGYLKPAAAMQKLANGYGVEIVYYPSGPLLEYNPAKVPNPPHSPQELLAYAKAHPGKVQY